MRSEGYAYYPALRDRPYVNITITCLFLYMDMNLTGFQDLRMVMTSLPSHSILSIHLIQSIQTHIPFDLGPHSRECSSSQLIYSSPPTLQISIHCFHSLDHTPFFKLIKKNLQQILVNQFFSVPKHLYTINLVISFCWFSNQGLKTQAQKQSSSKSSGGTTDFEITVIGSPMMQMIS